MDKLLKYNQLFESPLIEKDDKTEDDSNSLPRPPNFFALPFVCDPAPLKQVGFEANPPECSTPTLDRC
jgi:hypothetical protein